MEFDIPDIPVHQIIEAGQADWLNSTFSDFKPFPNKLVKGERCSSFFAEIEGKPAGWGYLVYHADLAYLAGMFTSPEFRQMGAATAILHRMHQHALEKGVRQIILSPSFMAWNFYNKRGYQTIAHYSTFLPVKK